MTAARRAQTTDAWSEMIPDRLEQAVRNYDLADTPAFGPLTELSDATEFDGISVDSNVIIVDQGRWSAPATVYVTLVYRDEGDSDDLIRSAAAFPATVSFSVEADHVEVTNVDIDLSSLFE